MKKTIKLAVVAVLALGATSAFATNGSNLIATGVKARGMGGASIVVSHGAENGLANAALITTVEGTEISFGGTIFMPKVSNTDGVMLRNPGTGVFIGDDSGSADSAADMSVIPEVSIVSKVSNNLFVGIGMWGTAGMGVDYRDPNNANTGQMNMVTNLQLMQFGVPVAYKINNFSASITPVLQYGSLDINYVMSGNLQEGMGAPAGQPDKTVGNGVAQDLQFGYNIGLAYEIAGVTIGAMYKSQIDMEYKGQLSGAIQGFGVATYDNDKLSTPAEIGIGVSYAIKGHTIAVDYKNIKWSDAKGYEDFAWEDQNVYAIGYEYAASGWAVRLGYNYADSPISEQKTNFGATGDTSTAGAADLSGSLVNTFNLLGFPGIVTSHMTLGGTYELNKQTSVDLAYVYAPKVTETYTNFVSQDITTEHSQTSLSLAVNFNF